MPGNALMQLAQSQPQQPRRNPLQALAEGMVRPGNINLDKRPKVDNGDGSFSTIESMSANVGGVEVLFPTITPDGRRMSPDEAYQRFMQTGEHLGYFASPQLADVYARSLSARQGRAYLGEQTKVKR